MTAIRTICDRSATLSACLVGTMLFGLTGCNGPIRLSVSEHVARPNPRIVLFFIDGLNRGLFRQWLEAGELPNIKRYIADRGVEVENAVSCVPSITYANTASLLTGRLPGHAGVTGNKWFDRQRMFYQDYRYGETYRRINDDAVGPTIYELLPDRYTVSIQSPLTRGVSRTYYNDITASVTWYLGLLDWTDRLMPLRFEEIAQEVSAQPQGQWPKFVHTYLPAVDEYGHRYGIHHWGYKYAVRNADQQIGRICEGLIAAGLFDRATLVLVSDHGMIDIDRKKRFDVSEALKKRFERRVPATWMEFSTDYQHRCERLSRYDTVVLSESARKCSIHFRYADDWSVRPGDIMNATPHSLVAGRKDTVGSMVRYLASQPAVRVVAVPTDKDEVTLYGGRGTARLIRRVLGQQTGYRYDVIDGREPLGYESHAAAVALMDGTYHSRDDWFAATVGTDAPDLPGQLCEMFDTPRSGDVVLFAANGWGLGWVENAGHGSLSAEEMFVPMLWAGPDIAAGAKVSCARVCDVMPTILEIAGVSDRLSRQSPIDGVSLLSKMRRPVSVANR